MEFLLSCTPLSVHKIIAGQWQALQRQFLRPLIAILIADSAMMLVGFFRAMPRFEPMERLEFALFVLATMLMLVADMITMAWVGMWYAMSKKKPRHAAGATVAWVVGFPNCILILIVTICGIIGAHFTDSFAFAFMLGLWFFLGIAVDVSAISLARPQLLSRFRALAAVQTGEEFGLMGQLGRMLGHLRQSVENDAAKKA